MHFLSTYPSHVRKLLRWKSRKRALSLAVGGEFDAVGMLEFYLLLQLGLRPEHSLIDVGCGSGRLAVKLREYLKGSYLGTDVVDELLDAAQEWCPSFSFQKTNGTAIPARSESTDFVCFFSVFTHLQHEESYRYLAEAKRVLKPGGLIVFSFLEFACPGHWNVFEAMISRPNEHLDKFMSRDAIEAWASHLDLRVVAVHRGDESYIKLPAPVTFSSGRTDTGASSLGQSVCVLQR